MSEETKTCCICHAEKPLAMFNERPDGSGYKTICRLCEIRKRAEETARGVRKCATCGRRTINYRCARCWREHYGVVPWNTSLPAIYEGIGD